MTAHPGDETSDIESNVNIGNKREEKRAPGYQTPREPPMCFRHTYLYLPPKTTTRIVIDTVMSALHARLHLDHITLIDKK